MCAFLGLVLRRESSRLRSGPRGAWLGLGLGIGVRVRVVRVRVRVRVGVRVGVGVGVRAEGRLGREAVARVVHHEALVRRQLRARGEDLRGGVAVAVKCWPVDRAGRQPTQHG